MQGLPRSVTRTKTQALMSFIGSFAGLCLLGAGVYYGIGWTRQYMGEYALSIITLALLASYLVLLKVAARQPDLINNIEDEIRSTPVPGPTIKRGLYYLLPLVVLLWCLTVERYSPGLSAFWATLVMVFITLTHKTLIDMFRKEQTTTHLKEGFLDLIDGMTTGARNMIGIGVATATAGIVVGAVTLTGIGLVMTEFVEWISAGSIILMLLFTAIICLVLGMGLPTTANYIVVSHVNGSGYRHPGCTARFDCSTDRRSSVCFLFWNSRRRHAASWACRLCSSCYCPVGSYQKPVFKASLTIFERLFYRSCLSLIRSCC